MRLLQQSRFNSCHWRRPRNAGTASSSCSSDSRRRGLLRLDRELRRGNHNDALAVAKQLQRQHPRGLCCFGSGKLIQRRRSLSGVAEANGMELTRIKPLVDSMLDSIGNCMDDIRKEGVNLWDLTGEDEDAEESDEEEPMDHPEYDPHMCATHEAGHFLIGYLLGVLPKAYSLPLPGKDNLCERLRAGGAVGFVGFEFLREVLESFICPTFFGWYWPVGTDCINSLKSLVVGSGWKNINRIGRLC